MSFTLPSLLPRDMRPPRSALDSSGAASKGAHPKGLPGNGISGTGDGIGTLPALTAHRRPIDEGEATASKTLAMRLEQLELQEASRYFQCMANRCEYVEAASRQALMDEYDAACSGPIGDAQRAVQRAAVRSLCGDEGSARSVLEAASWRARVHLRQGFMVLMDEQHHRSAILSEATCDATVLRLHERTFTAAVVSHPFGSAAPRHALTTTLPQSDSDWSIPRDGPSAAVADACSGMGGIVPADVLQHVCATDDGISNALWSHRDASTRCIIEAQQLLDRIQSTVYTRERAHLDEDAPRIQNTQRMPYSLPGLVMPWPFVLEERHERRNIHDEASTAFLELETAHQVIEKCVHTEHRARCALMQLHMWVDEWRMERVLLVQRWWRHLALSSASNRRRVAIRQALPSAATTNRRAEETTVDVINDRIEAIEDATLRDLWAEDYATGEIGLFFPYRKQVLDIALDKCRRILYARFVMSLASQVGCFIRSAHINTARRMRLLFFSDEVDGRSTIMDDEDRVWRATVHMRDKLESLCRCPDSPSTASPVSALPLLPCAHMPLREGLRAACNALYQDHKRSEQRRVQYCRLGWQQFRVAEHQLVFDHRDADTYTAAVSARIGSADSVRRLSNPSSDRIPSAGYQRPGSSGYRRLSSAGYERLGSAGYNRLGSSERARSATRRGSAGALPQRLRSGGVRAAAPPPKRDQRQFPRFWEGYQCVREAKFRIAAAETAARKADLDDAYDMHVHYAGLFLNVLQRRPTELLVTNIGSLAHSMAVAVRQEAHARALEIEDELLTRSHLAATASAHKTAAELCQTTSLHHLATVDEKGARQAIEKEASRQWMAMVALMDRMASILAAATEHLRRTGMVPRGTSRPPGTVHVRTGSALQRDDLAHRRKNYASAARVATVIQRWWRLKHYKTYRVAEAGMDVLRLIRERGVEEARQLAGASVLQRQLSDVSGDQQLNRRMSSASSSHPRPPSSTARPRSALSNLQNATAESMRTVLSRRLLHHDLFSSWASAEQEESASRSEWLLTEHIQRCRLHAHYVDVVLAAAVAPKLHRIATRLEPTDRLRVEREALSSFVSLFFCATAETIRAMYVLDAEATRRRGIATEAEAAWRRLSATATCYAETHATLQDVQVHRRSSGPTIGYTAQHLVQCIQRQNAKVLRRARLVQVLPTPPTRVDDVHRCTGREDINRIAVARQEEHALQSIVARHLLVMRDTVEADLLSMWTRQCHERSLEMDHSAAWSPQIEYPIGAFLRLAMEQHEARAVLASSEAVAMGDVLEEVHTNFVRGQWRVETQRWRHMHASQAYDTTRVVSEALSRRVGSVGSKLHELEAMEANGRCILTAMESMRRDTEGLEESVRSAVWEMLRRAAQRGPATE